MQKNDKVQVTIARPEGNSFRIQSFTGRVTDTTTSAVRVAADGVSEREWFAVSSKLVTVSKI